MSGYNNNLKFDSCSKKYDEKIDEKQYNYTMHRNAVMRQGVNKCGDKGLGRNCTFYGPMDNSRVLRDSFLSGRGQVKNDCASWDVKYLPSSLFEPGFDPRPATDQSLEANYSRIPKSCNGISEIDVTQYAFMPGSFQRGFQGLHSIADTNLSSRDMARDDYKKGKSLF